MFAVETGNLNRGLGEAAKIDLSTVDQSLAKGGQFSKGDVFWPYLMRIEAGLLLTYAKVTGAWRRF